MFVLQLFGCCVPLVLPVVFLVFWLLVFVWCFFFFFVIWGVVFPVLVFPFSGQCCPLLIFATLIPLKVQFWGGVSHHGVSVFPPFFPFWLGSVLIHWSPLDGFQRATFWGTLSFVSPCSCCLKGGSLCFAPPTFLPFSPLFLKWSPFERSFYPSPSLFPEVYLLKPVTL